MRKQILATGFFLLSLMLPLKASAHNYDQIYVFGDSLSDTGNFLKATGMQGYGPTSLYYQGRYSNGPVWVEYLADRLGATSTNFAFGGATSGFDSISGIDGLPGLQQQINGFTAANPAANPNALYIVWAGANDYLVAGVTNPTTPVANLLTAVKSLAAVGAKNIMVPDLPDLGKVPATVNSPASSFLNDLTQAHNTDLTAALEDLSQNSHINTIPVDIDSIFDQITTEPERFGFTNVSNSCLVNLVVNFVPCANPNEYLFWDSIHPTTATHELLGELAFSALQAASVPEPSAVLGVLAFGALGASLLKRK